MDARIVNALLTSVVGIFTQVLQLEPKLGKPQVAKDIDPKYSIVTVLGFVGDIEGNMIYSFNEDTALQIVSRMMGMEYNRLDDLALSALGELGNMTTGSLAVNLEKIGYKTDITPPTVITGKEIKVSVEGVILKLPVQLFKPEDVELNLVMKK